MTDFPRNEIMVNCLIYWIFCLYLSLQCKLKLMGLHLFGALLWFVVEEAITRLITIFQGGGRHFFRIHLHKIFSVQSSSPLLDQPCSPAAVSC